MSLLSSQTRPTLGAVFCLLLTIIAATPSSVVLAEGELSIDSFSVLTGLWSGEGLGGHSEEMWTPPRDGHMFGVFRQSSGEGELLFTEFLEIVELQGQFILRLKHFGADFAGWEPSAEYVSFPLVEITDEAIVFDGLRYDLISADRLDITVVLDQEGDDLRTARFQLRREAL